MKPVNVGNGHTIMAERFISVVQYGSRPTIRLKQLFERQSKVIDLTGGEKIKTLVLTEEGYLFLLSVKSDTLNQRVEKTE